jgi:hypothetical protein
MRPQRVPLQRRLQLFDVVWQRFRAGIHGLSSGHFGGSRMMVTLAGTPIEID